MKDIIKVSIKDHKEAFGIEPVIIGVFSNDPITISDNIDKAIEDNIPYNEYNMLSEDEKKAYDEDSLYF